MAKNGSRTHTHTPHTRSNTQKLITEIFYRKPFAPRVQCELVIFIIIFILIVSRTFRLQQKFSVLLRLFFAFVYFLHAIITNRGTADVVCNPYVCVLCVDSVFLLGQVFFLLVSSSTSSSSSSSFGFDVCVYYLISFGASCMMANALLAKSYVSFPNEDSGPAHTHAHIEQRKKGIK